MSYALLCIDLFASNQSQKLKNDLQRARGLLLTILSCRIVLPICNSISSSTTGHSSSQNSEAENKRQEQIQGGYASIFRHCMFAEQNCSDIVAVIRLQCHGCQHPSLLFGKSLFKTEELLFTVKCCRLTSFSQMESETSQSCSS